MSDKFSVSSCYRIILAVLSSLRALLMHSLFQASAAVSRDGGKASFVLGNPQKRSNCFEAFQQELSVTEMWKSPFSSFFLARPFELKCTPRGALTRQSLSLRLFFGGRRWLGTQKQTSSCEGWKLKRNFTPWNFVVWFAVQCEVFYPPSLKDRDRRNILTSRRTFVPSWNNREFYPFNV